MDRDELLERAEKLTVMVDARESEPEKPPKPWWRSVLESGLSTTLVTVLLGGWVGSCIAGDIQRRSSDHALRLAGYESYLQERLKVVQASIDLLGKMVAEAQSLISLSSQAWDPDRFPLDAQESRKMQRREIRKAFNEALARWRTENISLGLKLSYYHRGRQEVREAWNGASEAVSRFVECAVVWERENQPPADLGKSCQAEETMVSENLASLVEKIEIANEYIWESEIKP